MVLTASYFNGAAAKSKGFFSKWSFSSEMRN